ncbi:MAG: hypothetical protein KDJ52_07195 [Anaerolineae bacterium]|nr:hypothetical protein [Anaerolineae bacterium]
MMQQRTAGFASKKAAGVRVRTGVTAGSITVYGRQSCPWTVKQLNYFDQKGTPYRFIECSHHACPDFVQGFPTVDYHGQIQVGYKEYG